MDLPLVITVWLSLQIKTGFICKRPGRITVPVKCANHQQGTEDCLVEEFHYCCWYRKRTHWHFLLSSATFRGFFLPSCHPHSIKGENVFFFLGLMNYGSLLSGNEFVWNQKVFSRCGCRRHWWIKSYDFTEPRNCHHVKSTQNVDDFNKAAFITHIKFREAVLITFSHVAQTHQCPDKMLFWFFFSVHSFQTDTPPTLQPPTPHPVITTLTLRKLIFCPVCLLRWTFC